LWLGSARLSIIFSSRAEPDPSSAQAGSCGALHIHDCIEFGAADKKRRKEVIKVKTIRHLQEELKSKYNEYLSYTTLSNYMLPSRSNSIAVRTHYHPANIAIASVSRDEKKEHPDKHYCLSSVKGVNQFAALFLTHSVIIFKDDKAKVPLHWYPCSWKNV
jgi:hypothetical protein